MSINENMSESNFEFDRPPLRSSWNAARLLVRGRLTDRKIAKYQKSGWYSAQFRDARRELMELKKSRYEKRQGNFLAEKGRLIYSPK